VFRFTVTTRKQRQAQRRQLQLVLSEQHRQMASKAQLFHGEVTLQSRVAEINQHQFQADNVPSTSQRTMLLSPAPRRGSKKMKGVA
jgi:hypothetical protein